MTTRGDGEGWRIGDLARGSGLTVRALHHYESIGLLVASGRTTGGHRVYTDADVSRLYRISLLRQLGLPLTDIARTLDGPGEDVRETLAAHLVEVDRRLAQAAAVRARVQRLLSQATGDGAGPTTHDLLYLLEEMTLMDTAVQQRISILVYADLEARFTELVDVFGLGPGELVRDPDGAVVHGEIHAGDGTIWLHPERTTFGLRSPQALGAATAMTAVMVDDVDAHFRRASERGAAIVYEPVDQPYGYREYGARDGEGGLWSFMRPLA